MEATLNIELNNVKVSLPNGRVLFVIPQFSIPYGSHILIQGESGKGKTTFLHLLAGLFKPQEGHVKIGDDTLDSMSDNQLCDLRRKKIGVIFQKLNILDHLTAQENVELSSHQAEASLARVNMKERSQDRCSYMSLGEQQRVAVARVLAQEPDVILADEPTSSLDETNAEFVLEALKESAKGKTLIVVSHDHRISKYFDKVLQFEEITK